MRGVHLRERIGVSRMHKTERNGRHTSMVESRIGWDDSFTGTLDDTQTTFKMNPIQVLRQRLWIILLVAILVTSLAAGITFLQTPVYSASIQILVGQELGNSAEDNLISEVSGVQGVMETVALAVQTRPVAEGVVEELDAPITVDEVQGGLTAEQVGTSQFITVSYTDTRPERAQLVANTVGEVFSQQVSGVSSSANELTTTVAEPAVLPTSPISPNPTRNIALAALLGLMLGVGLAFLLDHLDEDWKSPEEAEQVSGVPTFGIIPTYKVPKRKRSS